MATAHVADDDEQPALRVVLKVEHVLDVQIAGNQRAEGGRRERARNPERALVDCRLRVHPVIERHQPAHDLAKSGGRRTVGESLAEFIATHRSKIGPTHREATAQRAVSQTPAITSAHSSSISGWP
jgi:hypothetical protein